MGDDAPHPRDDTAGKRSDVFDRKYDNDAQKKAWEDAKYSGAGLYVIEFSDDGSVKLKYKTSVADEDATVWMKRKPGGGYVVGIGYGEENYGSTELTKAVRELFEGRGLNYSAKLPPMDYIIDNGRLLSYEEYVFKFQNDTARAGELLGPKLYKQISERYWRNFQEGQKSDPETVDKFRQLIRENEQRRQEQERYRTWGAPSE